MTTVYDPSQDIGAPPSGGGTSSSSTYYDPSSAAPPAAGARRSTTPLGVPKGYTTPAYYQPTDDYDAAMLNAMAVGERAQIQPRYMQGDQWREAPTSPQDIATLQKALIETGLLSPSDVLYGRFDPKTADAFARLLAASNQRGSEWHDELAYELTLQQNPDFGMAGASGKAPLQIRLTNPDDLKATFQNVAQSLYGGNLPDDVVGRMVTAYQNEESAAQTAAYNASNATTQGSYTSVESPTVFAENQIKQQYPNQVAATEFGSHMDDIISTFTGSHPGATGVKG